MVKKKEPIENQFLLVQKLKVVFNEVPARTVFHSSRIWKRRFELFPAGRAKNPLKILIVKFQGKSKNGQWPKMTVSFFPKLVNMRM